MRFAIILAVAGPVRPAHGHGNLLVPYPWQDRGGLDGMRLVTHGMSLAGCGLKLPGVHTGDYGYEPCTSQWYTNQSFIPGSATLPEDMRTWMNYEFVTGWKTDYTSKNPWRAPGTASVQSPCGVFGGNIEGCPPGNPKHGNCNGGGWGRGPDARATQFESPLTAEWKQGSVVEAIWGLMANHGGGYSYRLCKRPASGNMMELTEACFENNVLDFVGDKQWLQFGNDYSDRLEIPAKRTRTGTKPRGSQWTRNPIPAFNCPSGGSIINGFDGLGKDPHGCNTPQFPPPRDDLWGFGTNRNPNRSKLMFGIVDKLQVPSDIPLGDYVLSWRWDVEQTPQVWTTCANVKLVADETPGYNEGLKECSICHGGPSQLKASNVAGVLSNGHEYSCKDAQALLLRPDHKAVCWGHSYYWRPRCCDSGAALVQLAAGEEILSEASEQAIMAMAGEPASLTPKYQAVLAAIAEDAALRTYPAPEKSEAAELGQVDERLLGQIRQAGFESINVFM